MIIGEEEEMEWTQKRGQCSVFESSVRFAIAVIIIYKWEIPQLEDERW